MFRVSVVHVIKHPTKILGPAVQLLRAGGKLSTPPELSREFPAPETGLMVELPPLDTALDNILKFSRIVSWRSLGCHFKMGLDHIAHIPQQQCGPLLDVG